MRGARGCRYKSWASCCFSVFLAKPSVLVTLDPILDVAGRLEAGGVAWALGKFPNQQGNMPGA